jgi:hypothetical protein
LTNRPNTIVPFTTTVHQTQASPNNLITADSPNHSVHATLIPHKAAANKIPVFVTKRSLPPIKKTLRIL